MGFETLTQNVGRDRVHDGFGGYWERDCLTELITLSTSGTTTDSAAGLLPANSIIAAVTGRVHTTITTATAFSIGDVYVSDRFTDPLTTLTAGAQFVGLNHVDQANASPVVGARQSTSGKLRITTTGTPGAGKVRVTVWFWRFVAPSS